MIGNGALAYYQERLIASDCAEVLLAWLALVIVASILRWNLKSINLKNIVKPEILGGFIIRFDGKEYNASVKQNLNNLKTQLTN